MKKLCMFILLVGLAVSISITVQNPGVVKAADVAKVSPAPEKEAAPANAIQLENFVPAEAAAFVKIHDFNLMREHFLAAPLGRLWSETSFKDVFLPLDEMWSRYKNKKQKEEGLNFDDLQKLFRGQVALSLIYEDKNVDNDPELRWVLLAEVNPGQAGMVLQAFAQKRADALEKISVKGVDIWSHKTANLSFALNGALFMLGDSSLELTRFVERAQAKELTLAASDEFKNAAKHVAKGDVNYYIFSCSKLFADFLGEMVGEPKDNLKRYGPAYGSISFDKRGVNDNLFIAVNGEIPESFKLLTQGQPNGDFQKLIPATTPLAAMFDVNFKKQLKDLREVSFFGELMPNQLLGLLEAEAEKKAHLFDDFTGKYFVCVDMARKGQAPAEELFLVQMLGFRDQDSARKFVFEYFKNLTGGESREQKKSGRGLIFYDKEKNSEVTLGLLDNYVLCGDRESLEQFLASKQSLGEMPGVQTALKNLSAPDAPWGAYKPLVYFSPQKATEMLLYVMMADEGGDLIESGLNLGAFPTRRELQERLPDGFLAAAPADGGVKLLLQGPVVNPLLFVFAFQIMDGFNFNEFDAEPEVKDHVEKKTRAALRHNLFRLDGFDDAMDALNALDKTDREKVVGLLARLVENARPPERIAAAGILNSLANRTVGEIELLKKLAPELTAALDNNKVWKSMRIEAFYVLATSSENFRSEPPVAEKIRAITPVFAELATDPVLFPSDRKLLIEACLSCDDNQALLDSAMAILKDYCFSDATDDFSAYALHKVLTFACQTPEGQTIKFVMEYDPESKETDCDEVILPAPTEEQKKEGKQTLIISDRSGQRLKLDAKFGKNNNVVNVAMEPVDKNGKPLPDKKITLKFLDSFSRELKISFTREEAEEPFEQSFTIPAESDLWKIKARKP